MAPFDYVVSLNLAGRRCLVLGGGPLAADRLAGLLEAGAEVEVYTADPSPAVAGLADDTTTPVTLHPRTYRRGDLEGAFLAIATREDDADVRAAWEEAEAAGVLFAALDDVDHCHFAAPARVRRGDLSVTVSTAGRAPALSKRLRQRLEEQIDGAYGELVEVLHEAREAALPRTVPFDEWAGRWAGALDDLDGLLELLRAGRREAVRRRVLAALGDGHDTTGSATTTATEGTG